jgi:Tfp pilus assembly pilus retraction ATPase PilT
VDKAELLVSGVTDWRVDLSDPANTVIFLGPKAVPDELLQFATKLPDVIHNEYEWATPRRRSFVVTTNETRYRVQYMHADRFAAQTLQSRVFDLYGDLNLQKVYCDMLVKPERRRTGGLVLIVGNSGSGKTTTAASTIAARLKTLADTV